MEVASHPNAILTDIKVDRVYCPIVSSRHIPVQNSAGGLSLFCDWEEVSTPAAEAAWMEEVCACLGTRPERFADEAAGFEGKTVRIWNEEKKLIPIDQVTIGSYIIDGQNMVKVLGLVKRRGNVVSGISDGVWIKHRGHIGWKQFFHPANLARNNTELYHLITDSGTFTVMYEGIAYVVRDATEVGVDRIRSLTPIVLSELNK